MPPLSFVLFKYYIKIYTHTDPNKHPLIGLVEHLK